MAANFSRYAKGQKAHGERVTMLPALSYVKDGATIIETFNTCSLRLKRLRELEAQGFMPMIISAKS